MYDILFYPTEYTLQLDSDVNAVRVTDSKVLARTIFLDRNELPKAGGKNPLREAWNGNYAVEIFYFPASSLKITNILRCCSLEYTVYALAFVMFVLQVRRAAVGCPMFYTPSCVRTTYTTGINSAAL